MSSVFSAFTIKLVHLLPHFYICIMYNICGIFSPPYLTSTTHQVLALNTFLLWPCKGEFVKRVGCPRPVRTEMCLVSGLSSLYRGWGGLVFFDSHCFSLLMWASACRSTDLSCLSPPSVRPLPPLLHSGIFSQLSHDQVTGSTLLASIPPPLCLSALIPPFVWWIEFSSIFLSFFYLTFLTLSTSFRFVSPHYFSLFFFPSLPLTWIVFLLTSFISRSPSPMVVWIHTHKTSTQALRESSIY